MGCHERYSVEQKQIREHERINRWAQPRLRRPPTRLPGPDMFLAQVLNRISQSKIPAQRPSGRSMTTLSSRAEWFLLPEKGIRMPRKSCSDSSHIFIPTAESIRPSSVARHSRTIHRLPEVQIAGTCEYRPGVQQLHNGVGNGRSHPPPASATTPRTTAAKSPRASCCLEPSFSKHSIKFT
jgi:hypothetical protein